MLLRIVNLSLVAAKLNRGQPALAKPASAAYFKNSLRLMPLLLEFIAASR
jgi:hypothetical protein